MFRTIRINNGALEVLEGADGVVPPGDGEMCWIDLQSDDKGNLLLLQQRFGLHPLAIEDCAHISQRAKVDEYAGQMFLVAHSMRIAKDGHQGGIRTSELDAFLVTATSSPFIMSRLPAWT